MDAVRTRSSHSKITVVVCLGLAAVTAAMASLNVALPDLARETHASQTQLSWIIDAYSLLFAVLLLPGGALGDRYGRRRALLTGLVIFIAGSGAAMASSSPNTLIALRGVIGIGAALVMPATLSTITATFPPEKRVRAVSVWAGVAGAAAVVGLLICGALLEAFSWRSAFAVNIGLGLIALIGTLIYVPESADPQAPRLDLGGAMLSIAGLVALVYSIIEAPEAGWLTARTLVGLTLGVVILAAFIAYELRQAHPMLDPRIFTRRGLSAGSLSIFVQFFAFYGFVFLILQYLQIVRRETALVAAASMLPMAATMMPTSRLAPMLASRFGTRRLCVSGLLLMAIGFSVIAQVDATSPYWLLAVGLLVSGAGLGAAMTPATSAITAALPSSRQGVASAMNDLSREVGGALGIAVLGSLMSAVYRGHLQLPAVPDFVADAARASIAEAARLGGPIAEAGNTAFLDGMRVAFYVAAGAAGVAAVVVGLLLGKQRAAAGADDVPRARDADGPVTEPAAPRATVLGVEADQP